MDFAKSFDKVTHRRLLHKLEYYGIRGSTHKWINSWLSGRTQQVVLDGQASDPVPVLSGVPQGSVLGPVLFLIFINDLPDNIRSSVGLFADDCVLYRNIHSLQDCLTLQEDLTSLGQWEADWHMKFNVAKCHSMRVTRHQHHKQILFDYSLHNKTLENVQSAKYLAITNTDNIDWGQHVSEIASKATKTLGFLHRNLAFAPRSTKEVAYKTLVRPKLEYAAPIWSPHSKLQINQIEKVQRTAARWTCRRWQNTSSVGPGRVAQSVTCLATVVCLTADPGVASSIPARSHTFVKIDHEIISTVILLPSADSGLLSVKSESMCTNYWLTACSSLPRKTCG